MISNLSVTNLEGIIRRYMGLGSSLWPLSVASPAWPRPIILHHGLALKFAKKGDVDHVFLCGYCSDTVRYPTELWLGTHHGRSRLRFLKKLSTLSEHYTLMLSADPIDSTR